MIIKSSECDYDEKTGQFIVRGVVDEAKKTIKSIGKGAPTLIPQYGATVRGPNADYSALLKQQDGPTIVIVDCGDYAQLHDSTFVGKK